MTLLQMNNVCIMNRDTRLAYYIMEYRSGLCIYEFSPHFNYFSVSSHESHIANATLHHCYCILCICLCMTTSNFRRIRAVDLDVCYISRLWNFDRCSRLITYRAKIYEHLDACPSCCSEVSSAALNSPSGGEGRVMGQKLTRSACD